MRSRNILFVVFGVCFIASLLNSAAAQAPSRPAPSKVQKKSCTSRSIPAGFREPRAVDEGHHVPQFERHFLRSG